MSEYRDEVEHWILNQAKPPVVLRPTLLAAIELGVRLGREDAVARAALTIRGCLQPPHCADDLIEQIRVSLLECEPAAVLRKP